MLFSSLLLEPQIPLIYRWDEVGEMKSVRKNRWNRIYEGHLPKREDNQKNSVSHLYRGTRQCLCAWLIEREWEREKEKGFLFFNPFETMIVQQIALWIPSRFKLWIRNAISKSCSISVITIIRILYYSGIIIDRCTVKAFLSAVIIVLITVLLLFWRFIPTRRSNTDFI
jgi:hypothetical protein